MVIEISGRNLSTRYYNVERREEGPEEVILDEETAFDILDGKTDTEGIVALGPAYASFRIAGGTDYSGTGYLSFSDTEGYAEAKLHTQSEELREGPGREILSISVLPPNMDPNMVGRNPLI